MKGTREFAEKVENRSKGTSEFQNQEQAARKRPKKFERELENKEQTARKDLEISEERAARSKVTRGLRNKQIENKKQAAREELETYKTRSKPLEND